MLIVCDFDESATPMNAAQTILARLGGDRLQPIHDAYRSGALPFREYQEACFDTLDLPVRRIARAADDLVALRPGFVDAVEAAADTGARFIVASAGLAAYIGPVLAAGGLAGVPVIAVTVKQDAATGRIIQYDYPDAESWCRSEWAVCKCRPMREALAAGEEVVFVGDGLRSDSCAAGIATTVFARGKLLEYCLEHGIPVIAYDDFYVLADYIRAHAGAAGTKAVQETAEGR